MTNVEAMPARLFLSSGDMIADRLKAAGNNVTHQVYPGVTHEFFGMDAVVAKAGQAQDFAVAQLSKGWAPISGKVESVDGAPLKVDGAPLKK